MSSTITIAPQPEADITLLFELPNNPRRVWGDMAGLEASVRAKGVLEPLLVRRVKDRLQVVAGARRFRAAKAAGLATVPVALRELTDEEALELAIIENLQRHDVHAMDEARAYAELQKAKRSPAEIAAKVGKDVSYVYRRLKLNELVPTAVEAFERDEITGAHAEILARLAPKEQAEALGECIHESFLFRDEDGKPAREPAPLAELKAWVQKRTKVEPASEDAAHYFPELAEELEAEAETLVQLSDSSTPGANLNNPKHGVIGALSWKEIRSKRDECEHARKGVVVHGGPMRIVRCCVKKGCPKHRPPATKAKAKGKASGAATQESWQERDRRERAERERRETLWREQVVPTLKAQAVAWVAGLTDAQLIAQMSDDLDDAKAAMQTSGAPSSPTGWMRLAVLQGVLDLMGRSWNLDHTIKELQRTAGLDAKPLWKKAQQEAAAAEKAAKQADATKDAANEPTKSKAKKAKRAAARKAGMSATERKAVSQRMRK